MDGQLGVATGQAASALLEALIATAPASLGLVGGVVLVLALIFYLLGRMGRRRTVKVPEPAATQDEAQWLEEQQAVVDAAHVARREADEARRVAETDLFTALNRAERAEATASTRHGERATLERALRQAEGEAAAARADAEALRGSMAEIDGSALLAAAARFESGEGNAEDVAAEAAAFTTRHASAMATAAQFQAFHCLADAGQGVERAARLVAAARLQAASLSPAMAEDLAILQESLEAASRPGAKPLNGPEDAMAQQLPRLAEILWRQRASGATDDTDRGLALSGAADAALWGGRWSVAALLARRAEALLAEGDRGEALLSTRLTRAQADLFAGAPGAAGDLAALAEEAAARLGDVASVTATARRLAARAAFEQGDDTSGEALAAQMKQNGIDPLTDTGIRAAKARGMLQRGKAKEAQGLFEALARQSKAGSRSALGYRLDALEAALAAGTAPDEIRDTLRDMADGIAAAFGTRHARCGHAALLTATALEALGETDRALGEASRAAALFALRLDPDHRWRRATTALLASLGGDEPADETAAVSDAATPADAAEDDQAASQPA